MAAKSIREYHGKKILSNWMGEYSGGNYPVDDRLVMVDANLFSSSNQPFEDIAEQHSWVRRKRHKSCMNQ